MHRHGHINDDLFQILVVGAAIVFLIHVAVVYLQEKKR